MTFGARFLAQPDLFPARLAGETWGDEAFDLDLLGEPYRIEGLDAAQRGALEERFAGLAGSTRGGSARAVLCRTFRAAPEDFHRFDLRGFELTLDAEHEAQAVRYAGYDTMARIEWRSGITMSGVWTSTGDAATFVGTVENLLRPLVAYRAVELGGALLHSAGVADGERGWLFVGRSGDGKSTLSRLSLGAGKRVLSDDLNALLPARGGGAPRLVPVPFAGDVRPPVWASEPVALAGIGRLAKGEPESLRPLPRHAALAGLAACAPYVNRDPVRADALLANLERLLHSTPAFLLTFALDGNPWRILSSAAASHAAS